MALTENKVHTIRNNYCWFHGSCFKGFVLFFLYHDWLKWNHLRSRIERGFLDSFSRYICSAVTETIRVTTTAQVLARKDLQKAKFEAAEMILGPGNQQIKYVF